MSSGADNVRAAKLSKLFNDVLYGRRTLSTSRDAKLFLEAMVSQPDQPKCAYQLISSPTGLSALQSSFRLNTTTKFLNDEAEPVLRYLQSPLLKAVSSGAVLCQILQSIIEPPFFFDAFEAAFRLITLPAKPALKHLVLAKNSETQSLILKSPDAETRIFGEKIKRSLSLDEVVLTDDEGPGPGGRHDNDFPDYKQIAIMPTQTELLSGERPFLRMPNYFDDLPTSSQTPVSLHRLAIHKDSQFRLLREDMLGEIREELQKLTGAKSGRHKGVIINYLTVIGIEVGNEKKSLPWGIKLQCEGVLPYLSNIKEPKRKEDLQKNSHILKHQNMGFLMVDNEVVSFPTIHRDIDGLLKPRAEIVVQLPDDASLHIALSKVKVGREIKFIQLDAAIFAYEPFLKRLQNIKELSLAEDILQWEPGKILRAPKCQPTQAINALQGKVMKDVRDFLKTNKSVRLDESQLNSLLASLKQRVSLVQGPPGTGKSFIGALIAKILHDQTTENILVICYTNHALDQFLEDLLDIGIPSSSMVRLGGKSTDRTKHVSINELRVTTRLAQSDGAKIDKLKTGLKQHEQRLRDAFSRYAKANIHKQQLMEYLEFASEDLPFFDAFLVVNEGHMTQVGKHGKAVGPYCLLDRWMRGLTDAGALQHKLCRGAAAIWKMTPEMRRATLLRWQSAILDDHIGEIYRIGQDFNADQAEIDCIFSQREASVIKSKRIIACTTTAAAKYFDSIQSTSPGIVLVEEAGEILEAHIFTALGPSTEQLILIGDHHQLRPKCSYELGVEKGEGYDLNRSLFERLILRGYPHVTLSKQHRMRPEISSLIRHLTYPSLVDADTTLSHRDLRGFRGNVIFVNHTTPEIELQVARELRDNSTSKQNLFEAQMILKCVRYLVQQGYGSSKIVVLTPYLGQLKLLRDQLAQENDPILNDLDKSDLIRAGLLTNINTTRAKPGLKISTVDNYQGEESDIVLVSLTRSNASNDIGFMSSPERLNVLLSRAREALILIGNSATFTKSRKGCDLWTKFFELLVQKGYFYEGFPVKCENHPSRHELLRAPSDFELYCPDGGCREPCGALLNCGQHKCPRSCHQRFDHSRIKYMAVINKQCSQGHPQSWQCGQPAPMACPKCVKEEKDAEKRALKALKDQQRRDEQIARHQQEVAKLQEEIDQATQAMRDVHVATDHEAVLQQMRKDLKAAQEQAKLAKSVPKTSPPDTANTKVPEAASQTTPPAPSSPRSSSPDKSNQPNPDFVDNKISGAKDEWQRQKDLENASNPAIDKITDMIGLNNVKNQVLRIKAKVDTSKRQDADLRKERFGLLLLGNPGTGKTTVARYYARILTTLGVLPGDGFVETTGSRFAYGGVGEVKKHLASLESGDGGVYFIDEAYQLTQPHNPDGKKVLDYLAEIENLTGMVVFVFAGYRKEMESFLEFSPGIPSRIPYTLHFDDYTNFELMKMLQYQINQCFQRRMKVENGLDGLYTRIAIRRLGRGRGRPGFGNARALENVFARIRESQSDRLTKERRAGLQPDDFLITKEDLIGPDPSKATLKCDAWEKLQKLTGLKEVKNSISILIDLIKANYERELQEKPPIDVSLNRVFLGSPAKLYGQILADIGMLSNGEVVLKNPSDFIGSHIGGSEENTKKILASTVGKVLIIDEAYMLYARGSSEEKSHTDIFRTAVIDTIVAEVQNVPGDDRCVLLLGYEDQMIKMFQNVNPGLTRRFQLSDAFRFEDFDNTQLEEILRMKLKTQGLGANEEAINIAINVLDRRRNALNFGNGGDVETLITTAKSRFQARQKKLPVEQRSVDFVFQPQDFDPDHDRATTAEVKLHQLFEGVIGCGTIVDKLQCFIRVAEGMRAHGKDPRGQIPMNFIFKGPPGTGKTTTARKFGEVFYSLGFLSEVEVVEISATDLIGQYVGHTGPKCIKQLERGLGKVLFVDEAYRLSEGHFAKEAISELVDSMTKPKFAGKLVIILAGYDNDMNVLLKANEGLSSRSADEIIFPALSPDDCVGLLEHKLRESNIAFPGLQENPALHAHIVEFMRELRKLPGWGNARDVQTLAKSMARIVFQSISSASDPLTLSDGNAIICLEAMLLEKQKRNKIPYSKRAVVDKLPFQSLDSSQAAPPPSMPPGGSNGSQGSQGPQNGQNSSAVRSRSRGEAGSLKAPGPNQKDTRDPGVSDEIWEQLQKDKLISVQAVQAAENRKLEEEEALRKAKQKEEEMARIAKALQEVKAKDEAERRMREQAWIREMEAKAERERIEQEAERRRKEEAERKRQEAQIQSKLRHMGVCCQGYRWIKQDSGYRCAGGSHYKSNAELGI